MKSCEPAAPPLAPELVDRFDESIAGTFRSALVLTLRSPRLALVALRALRGQRRARARRAANRRAGLHVPPFMILSITSRCNLTCAGCYARAAASRTEPRRELDPEQLRSVVAQARELGIGIVLIAGGEPLLRPDVLELGPRFPDVIFLLFTNGILLDERAARRVRRSPNVVPIISIEGRASPTDERRGDGVYRAALRAMLRLRHAGVFFGTSITVTSSNRLAVTELEFVRSMRLAGCRHFIYVEYVPIEPETESLALDGAARVEVAERIERLRHGVRALFTAFPGGEQEFGGCLAAGRGFIHVSPSGAVEPCPFAPYSDSALTDMTLEQGLRSPLLRAIREADGALHDTRGGCALWAHRDLVDALCAEHARPLGVSERRAL